MKKYIYPLLVLLMLPAMLITSCKDDDDTAEPTEDCYISGVTLGSLYRTMYLKTSKGQDSIYTTTFSGNYFPMTIDQRQLTIENLDSLPIRTRLERVKTAITFQGTLYWRKVNNPNGEWVSYNGEDSLDLSTPLHLRVFSQTGNSNRIYTLSLNTHKQNGDSTVWNQLGETDVLNGMAERKMTTWNGQVTVFGKKSGSDLLTCAQHPFGTIGTWTSATTTGTTNATIASLQKMGNKLYLSTTDGNIIESSDALTWSATSYPTMTGLTLVAASDEYLYGLCDKKLYRSNGSAWEEEKLDDSSDNMPTISLNSVFYTMNDGMKRLLLIGLCNTTDKKATIWAKGWSTGEETMEKWMYYTPNATDRYRCPAFANLCVLPYDGGLQALGGKTTDGKYTALSTILHSSDHGISWKDYENGDMNVDTELQTAARAAQYIVATVDDDQFLWIATDNKIWRGRINRLGFKKSDK